MRAATRNGDPGTRVGLTGAAAAQNKTPAEAGVFYRYDPLRTDLAFDHQPARFGRSGSGGVRTTATGSGS